jgi:hypothetical protein
MSRHVVNNVTGLWGMQVADIKTGQIISAIIPRHPPEQPGLLRQVVSSIIPLRPLEETRLLHGIGWTPDESEVWENSSYSDPHVYVWDMSEPMVPKFKERLSLKGKHGGHWLTFDLTGDYAYIAPEKNSEEATEVFNAGTHKSVGSSQDHYIASSPARLFVDFEKFKNVRTEKLIQSFRHSGHLKFVHVTLVSFPIKRFLCPQR